MVSPVSPSKRIRREVISGHLEGGLIVLKGGGEMFFKGFEGLVGIGLFLPELERITDLRICQIPQND